MEAKRRFVEDVAIIGGLIGVQFLYAGNSVLQSYIMFVGLPPTPLIISSNFVTFLILSPLAIFFERKSWPKRLSVKLLVQLVLISFAGVTLFQSLMLKGVDLTSPSMATAMPNLAPGLIFIIAWAFRLEKVDISCTYSRVKIVGTFLCVLGAITMSLMQSTKKNPFSEDVFLHDPLSSRSEHFYIFNKDRIIGCFYLVAAVIVLSSDVVLQAITLVDMPAPISLSAITSLIGVILTATLEFIEKHAIPTPWPIWSLKQLICYALMAGMITGVCFSFNAWAMKKRGPVLVSMFNPIGTVIAVIISCFLGQSIALGSLTGMFIMFTGLYFVLWAKGKEGFLQKDEHAIQSECHDVEKPLLQ
ncbi:WAT1-related protein At5g47470 [Cynara cardunculus var. scolymus]|uniref:WAT1-related protein At5g47470 n=1 Tax=Cynara cardunculus var. scolymus TaxID=59895 RepID=UPI000D62E14F|nr:WAT1-related protein At5g47470 [Cynara cardunculus var. scolymus]